MTRTWQLSKDSMKEMDLLSTVTDALDGLERPQSVSNEEMVHRLARAFELFQRLQSAAKTQTSKESQKDLFMLKLAENLEKAYRLAPSDFETYLSKRSYELGKREPKDISPETVELL
ncbi:MAG: hypothetical protein JRN15_21965, partial [Nitrososphaerota archaeon]|nr:hypothetical protein [Nitrososphaerota archaeon]